MLGITICNVLQLALTVSTLAVSLCDKRSFDIGMAITSFLCIGRFFAVFYFIQNNFCPRSTVTV